MENEALVLKDLALGLGYAKRTRKSGRTHKFYTLSKFLGETLSSYLKKNGYHLTDTELLKLAIDLCLLLTKLHRGDLSKTKTAWAHLDIKPENIVRDAAGELHFIDFAFTDNDIHERDRKCKGSFSYLADNWGELSKEKRDIFALLRTLYLPALFYNVYGEEETRHENDEWILHGKLIADIKLIDELVTDCDRQDDGLFYRPANQLTALLILAYFKLQRLYSSVNEACANSVISLYESGADVKAIEAFFNPEQAQEPAVASVVDYSSSSVVLKAISEQTDSARVKEKEVLAQDSDQIVIAAETGAAADAQGTVVSGFFKRATLPIRAVSDKGAHPAQPTARIVKQ